MNKWQRIKYQPNTPLSDKVIKVTASDEHIALSKKAATEGMVLLKNEDQVLPLSTGSKVALFGKGTFDYVKGGGGSGDVTVSYSTNLYEGFKALDDKVEVYEDLAEYYNQHVKSEYDAGKEPGLTSEPTLPTELMEGAKKFADTAVVTFCRFSGEGWDRKSSSDQDGIHAENWVEKFALQSDELFEDGDFNLSQQEKSLIDTVKSTFDKVIIVMNVGGMVASSWFKNDEDIQSVLMSWQGGMEGGSATAELICGVSNPSGKLVDTFAQSLADYPSSYNYYDSKAYVDYTDDIYVGYRYFETVSGAYEKVNYPFGFGLSYTTFDFDVVDTNVQGDQIEVSVSVKNSGQMAGKEVIQLYAMLPQGVLGKPLKNLAAFKKTKLLIAGETQRLTLKVNIADLASYDDLGKVQKSAYILEKGDYNFFVGTSVRDGVTIDNIYKLSEDRIVTQLSEKIAPTSLPKRMLADGSYEALEQKEAHDKDESVLDSRKPSEIDGIRPLTRHRASYMENYIDEVISLLDVAEGKETMDKFIDQLSNDELAHLLGGQENTGVANTFGFGNLPEYGIPNAMTADGPAGVRIDEDRGVCTTAWPCSTLLACTFDEELVYQVGEAGAKEVKENNLAIWLTPAVNIHRSPLCGRNFEYYSEDPLVAGKLAASMVKGIQSVGVSACVKHFALNNKETNRKNSDSRVSERAAREIYLKAFEIIVKEADPWCMMTSYNIINGYRASANKELLEDILRGEWGYNGAVTTDWWTYAEHYQEVKAGNDIKMACGFPDRLLNAIELGALTREDLELCAKRVLELLIKID